MSNWVLPLQTSPLDSAALLACSKHGHKSALASRANDAATLLNSAGSRASGAVHLGVISDWTGLLQFQRLTARS